MPDTLVFAVFILNRHFLQFLMLFHKLLSELKGTQCIYSFLKSVKLLHFLISNHFKTSYHSACVSSQGNGGVQPPMSPLYTPGQPPPNQFDFLALHGESLPLTTSKVYPRMALSDLISQTQTFITESQAVSQSKHGVMLKFVLTGLLSGVAPAPLVIRMCPPLTTKNWNVYQPLLALGWFYNSIV